MSSRIVELIRVALTIVVAWFAIGLIVAVFVAGVMREMGDDQ